MLKVKKIVVFLLILVLIVCFSFSVSALTSTYVQPGAPLSGSLTGYTSEGSSLRYFQTLQAINSTSSSSRSYLLRSKDELYPKVYSLIRAEIRIPIDVSVPDGLYWNWSSTIHCRYRSEAGGASKNAICSNFKVVFFKDGTTEPTKEIFSSSPNVARFNVQTATIGSYSGTISLIFTFNGTVNDVYDFYFDVNNSTVSYGLESEFINRQERDEFTQNGENAVGDVQSSASDKSGGFVSALGSFVNSMSYNGTVCKWKFPSIKLPAINGVMSETTLNAEQDIDFGFWVGKIPSNILEIVQILCTIALIVYCFKELYSTIQYVLTLKGGGDNG